MSDDRLLTEIERQQKYIDRGDDADRAGRGAPLTARAGVCFPKPLPFLIDSARPPVCAKVRRPLLSN
jgi:hypothetical protein